MRRQDNDGQENGEHHAGARVPDSGTDQVSPTATGNDLHWSCDYTAEKVTHVLHKEALEEFPSVK